MVGLVLPRSRLAFEHGVTVVNGPGLVEPGYRGELGVILVNLGADVFIAEAGDADRDAAAGALQLSETSSTPALSSTAWPSSTA